MERSLKFRTFNQFASSHAFPNLLIPLLILLVFVVAACSASAPDSPPPEVALNEVSPSMMPPDSVKSPESQKASPTVTKPPSANPAQPPAVDPTPSPVTSVSEFPDSSDYIWRPITKGFSSPVGVISAGDDSDRLFVIEQAGVINILYNNEVSPKPFLDIRDRVESIGYEQGLLGLAFHPEFSVNGYFYINYTGSSGQTVISRFQANPNDLNLADPDSEAYIMQIEQPFANHNGGMLAFGSDGYLYIGLGDGGSGDDPLNNGQSLETHLGKILRIDINSGDPYAIPQDNPFVDGSVPEIWAYGLRNPWRFAFDRLTGDLFIGDVGQNQWEEIDFLPADHSGTANFGWNYYEGSHQFSNSPPPGIDFIEPVAEYGHDLGCSVTGGVVYRGENLPEWQGIYLYGDFCSGRVWGLLQNPQGNWVARLMFENVGRITSFGEDNAGEVYLVDQGGTIFMLDRK